MHLLCLDTHRSFIYFPGLTDTHGTDGANVHHRGHEQAGGSWGSSSTVSFIFLLDSRAAFPVATDAPTANVMGNTVLSEGLAAHVHPRCMGDM